MLKNKPILLKENIYLGLESVSRDEAIKKAGQLLVESGYATNDYIGAMLEREEIVSTYIGNGVAMPHAVGKARGLISKNGLVILQYPKGIKYNGNICYLVIGICGKANDHIKILQYIAERLYDEEKTKKLWNTSDVDAIYSVFVNGIID